MQRHHANRAPSSGALLYMYRRIRVCLICYPFSIIGTDGIRSQIRVGK